MNRRNMILTALGVLIVVLVVLQTIAKLHAKELDNQWYVPAMPKGSSFAKPILVPDNNSYELHN